MERRQPGRTHEPWLALGEASRLLGVAPGTLRRWADSGQVPTFVTPGGHRRFPRAVVEALVGSRQGPYRLGSGGFSGDAMAAAYRRPRGRGGAQLPPWVAELSDAERGEFRDRGRILLQLVLEYLEATSSRQAESRLDAAVEVASEYGRRAAAVGASLSESVQGFLFFRAPFIGELARQAAARGMQTRDAAVLLVRAEAAMDRLLGAVMKGFG
jgi:excisionase family DNA binding protein